MFGMVYMGAVKGERQVVRAGQYVGMDCARRPCKKEGVVSSKGESFAGIRVRRSALSLSSQVLIIGTKNTFLLIVLWK